MGKGTRPAGRNPARCGAPSRRALRVSWSMEDGRVRRPVPTGCQIKYSRTGQREGQAPPLRGKRGNIPWQRTGGRVRRPAPTAFQVKYSRTGQREGQAPPLRGKRGNIPRQRIGGRVWDPPLRGARQNTAKPDNGRDSPALNYAALAGCPKKTDRKPGKIGGAPLKKFKNTLDTHGGVDV